MAGLGKIAERISQNVLPGAKRRKVFRKAKIFSYLFWKRIDLY